MNSFRQKLVFCSLLIAAMAIFALALAQETPAPTPENIEEDVSAQGLGVATPKILPDSKFYFLKEWQRKIQMVLTLNPVKKAELNQKITNEKLVELVKLSAKTQNTQVLEKAVAGYQKQTAELKNMVDKIKQTVQSSPAVEKFITKVVEQSVLQEKILQKLETQVPPQVFEKIQEVRQRHVERFSEVMRNKQLGCQTLWWFDNDHKFCQQGKKCGAYMYLGLRTFETKEECESSLNAR